MALCLRKDIKKSSYYVWFLGAKESKGLRGSEYVLPVLEHLIEREKDVEPFKVTLQISHKGLKIIQNIVTVGSKNAKPKNETIKHFIPHNTITCVYQQEDIIACILLLSNPVTKCPLHVHAYRCDSLETATVFKEQLLTLIERPENQKKFGEIENRLRTPKEAKKMESSLSSDTGTSTRESESSEERFGNDRVATLYDSVAAELRAKLNKNEQPILLPPRDYDTVHRQKGNLTGIELRRCLNSSIVGSNVKSGRKIDSSGASSGIGSDLPLLPESPDAADARFSTIDNQSTSDEEWKNGVTNSTLYLMHHGSSEASYHRSEKSQKSVERSARQKEEDKRKFFYNEKPKSLERVKRADDEWSERDRRYSREKFIENFAYEQEREYRSTPVPKARQNVRHYGSVWQNKIPRADSGMERYSKSTEYLLEDADRKRTSSRQRSPSPDDTVTPSERFKDAKEKFLSLESELKKEVPISPTRQKRHFAGRIPHSEKYFDEDDKPEPTPRSFRHDKSAERYKCDPKRRSMFCLVEEEHKRNSNDIAREIKRISYAENNNYEEDFYRNKQKDTCQNHETTNYARNQKSRNAAGYRHSYAEPKIKLEKSKKIFPDMLQRTNSSVSNSGRVGLASVHPY